MQQSSSRPAYLKAQEAAAASVAAASRAAAASVKNAGSKHQKESLRLRDVLAAARSSSSKQSAESMLRMEQQASDMELRKVSSAAATALATAPAVPSCCSTNDAHEHIFEEEEWALVNIDLERDELPHEPTGDSSDEEWSVVDTPSLLGLLAS
mmetsp:Transcript_65871/g.157464  ORF Transcript_65871/g.157464 Transcript_65871/m.157464 type:complete len:153 (-) Transcript_65871:224-682(-)